MRFPVVGALRLTLAAGAGVGLLAAATQSAGGLDLAGPASTAATASDRPDAGTDTPSEGGPGGQVLIRTKVLTCPGQELSGTVGVPDVSVAGTIRAVALPRELLPQAPAGPGSVGILLGDAAPAGPATVAEPNTVASSELPAGDSPVTVLATGSLAPGVTAGQEWRGTSDTVHGLAGSACTSPQADLWLIAGGGAPGRQERLVLTNPGANEVTASLDILGAQGRVTAGHDRGIVVPAGSRAVVLVDAIAGSEPSPVVHVTVSGGTVAATLTDTWLDGSVAAGAETAGPAAPPATRQVIPVALRAQSGSVRIGVPGDTQAVVSARVLTATGPVPLPGLEGVQRIQAHSVLELPLPAQSPDIVGVEVRSDVPIVAAALSQVRADGGVGDFAWSAGSPAITGIAGAALATGDGAPGRTLTMVASTAEVSATVVILSGGALTVRNVTVPADSVHTEDLGSPDAVWLQRTGGAGELRAGILSQVGSGPGALISALDLRDLPTTTTATTAVPLP